VANEKLKLKELGVRVEAMFEWPGQSDGSAPISMPEAATEIGERLRALEERLAPVARGPEPPAQLSAATTDSADSASAAAQPTEVAEFGRLLERLERRLDSQAGPAETLAGITARLEALEGGPSVPAALAEAPERLQAIEERLDDVVVAAGDLAAVARRIDAIEKAVGTLRPVRSALAEIGPRLDALEVAAAQSPELPDVLVNVPARLLALEQRVQRPVPSLEELAALALRVRALEEQPQVSGSLPAEFEEITARVDALEEREAAATTPPELDTLATRLAQLEQRFDGVLVSVDEVASLGYRLGALEERAARTPAAELGALAARLGALGEDRDISSPVAPSFEQRDSSELRDEPSPPVHLGYLDDRGSAAATPATGLGAHQVRSEEMASVVASAEHSEPGPHAGRDPHGPLVGGAGPSGAPMPRAHSELGAHDVGAEREDHGSASGAASASSDEAEVLELLRKEIASMHSEFGPLTVAPDASAPRAGSAAPDPVPASAQAGRRFKKGLRRGESDS